MSTTLERARDHFIAADGALKLARDMLAKAQFDHDQAAKRYQALAKKEGQA